MRIHQLVPGIMMGDATSNHTLEIDDRLRTWELDSAIYAQTIESSLRDRVRPLTELSGAIAADDLLIFHYGMFHPSINLFQQARCRRMLIYHNITPAHFFHGWEPTYEYSCRLGRLVLRSMTDCDLAVGDSEFNRQELLEAGFPAERTAVMPIFLTPGRVDALPEDAQLQQELRGNGRINWLTVGRVVPNKGLEEVIRTFYVYQQHIHSAAQLHIVGSRNLTKYNQALEQLITDLGLQQHVTFTGRVSDSQLKTYYQDTDLFISASYHEGFCVPLLESMYFGLPILARNATAIPETMGNAGVLFSGNNYGEIAEMAHCIVQDQELRQQILSSQKRQLTRFDVSRVEEALRTILQQLGLQ